jgi:parallel beta helix pectate lyase-like protein
MSPARIVAVASLALALACATKKNPKYCDSTTPCAAGTCDMNTRECVLPTDGGTDARDGGDASDALPRCTLNTQCGDGGPPVCDVDAGKCVECVMDGDCSGKAKTPICEASMCRACKTDSECVAAPSICLSDGHCATSTEVIFVEYNSNNCPGATGSTTNPYCAPNDAVAQLALGRNVIVIRGGTADRMTLATTGLAPVVVGKNGASIPASAATAVQVMSDDVIIRDLMITGGGTSPSSKGIVATGSSTKLTLSNVAVSLTVGGLGVQADNSASLTMDRCTIENNSRGGILVDGATFDITNTVIAKNGSTATTGCGAWAGTCFNSPTGTTRFLNNTVVSNVGTGVACGGAGTTVAGSIVFGNTLDVSLCTITPCCSGDPTLTADYHLMSSSTACIDQLDSALSTTHDIDGQVRPRGAKSDCGADEFQ